MSNGSPIQLAKSRKTALLIGATGLVGRAVLNILKQHPAYEQVIVFTRRPIGVKDPKVKVQVIDFEQLISQEPLFCGDDLFLCLGTTMRQAGTRAAFVKVDLTYNLIICRMAAANKVSQLILLSAVGAKVDSTFFYNRVKGALEDEIKSLPFWAIHILQPATLLGERETTRPMELVAGKLSYWIDKSFFKLGKYKPVDASQVAQAMVVVANRLNPGVHYYDSDEIHRLS